MSLYRSGVWFIKGMREYTLSGYEKASRGFNAKDLPDIGELKGRSFLVTGANSGIGKETTREIAKRGGTVHMVCRNKERGQKALEEIQGEAKNAELHLYVLDISRPAEVAAFARDFVSSQKQLHVLINNAGCMENSRVEDENGLEKNFATNTVGTHLLTVGLIPALKQEGDIKPRVIIVSSGGMLNVKLDPDDLQSHNMKKFDGTMVYAQNKRQQVVMTSQYAKTHTEIFFASMHPGWADTPAVQDAMPGFYEKMKSRLRSPSQGADTVVWLAISPAATKHPSGLFFQDRNPVPAHLPLAWTTSSESDEKRLMDKLDEYVKQFSA